MSYETVKSFLIIEMLNFSLSPCYKINKLGLLIQTFTILILTLSSQVAMPPILDEVADTDHSNDPLCLEFHSGLNCISNNDLYIYNILILFFIYFVRVTQ
jgi:hypothetical protein